MNITEEDKTCENSQLLEKLNSEADKTIKNVEAIMKKGRDAVCRADVTFSTTLKDRVNQQTKRILLSLIDKLLDINCDLELYDDDPSVLSIPYMYPGSNHTQLKFLVGENPWDFWLRDDNVDSRTIQKILLKKYQSEMLEPYPDAKPSESVCFFDGKKVLRGIVLQTINENRVRLQDCDSSAARVVSTSNVFKVDIDACDKHASAIKCTISKDSSGANFWTNDLRDLFWSVLKEDIWKVNILETLPGPFPSFLVDIDLRNEDMIGNLNCWIIDSLIPEVKKLNAGEDSITDFLSSEVLDPYYKNENFSVENINHITNKAIVNDKCKALTGGHETKQNNLNSLESNEPLLKNDQSNTEQQDNDKPVSGTNDEMAMSSEAACLPKTETESTKDSASFNFNKNQTKEENEESRKKVKVVDQLMKSTREFQTAQSNVPPTVTNNNHHIPRIDSRHAAIKSHPYHSNNVGLPNLPPQHHNYDQLIGQPVMYQGHPAHTSHPGWGGPIFMPMPPQDQDSNLPITNSNLPLPLSNERVWSSGNNTQSGNKAQEDNSKISNINNVNVTVNVMAPEFIPTKCSSSRTLQKSNTNENEYRNSYSRTPPAIREVFHVEVRKPHTCLKPGEKLLVMLAHVQTPFEFYVHLITHNNKHIDRLLEDMLNDYDLMEKITFSSWREARDILGKFCACKWLEDNYWYRVEVLDWAYKDNEVKVYFVDFGNTEVVPLSCLQPLKTQYTKLSMCAQPCHLAKIHPLNRQETWSEESLQFFKSKLDVLASRAYTIKVVPSHENKIKMNSLSVLLYEGKMTDDSISINEVMVNHGFAWSKTLIQKSQSTDSEIYHSLEETSSQFSDETTNAKSKVPTPSLFSNKNTDGKSNVTSPIFSNKTTDGKSNVVTSPIFNNKTTDGKSSVVTSPIFKNETINAPSNLQLPSLFSDVTINANSSVLPLDKNTNDSEIDDTFDSWDPQAEDYYSLRNNPFLDTDDPCVAVSGYSARDEARICKFYAKQGFCRKSYCNKEHSMPNKDGTTTDKVETYMKPLAEIPLPSVGEIIDVKVTSVAEMSIFYVQLKENQAIDFEIDDEEETLSDLISYMNQPKNIQTMKPLLLAPAVGQLVLAKADDVWHRARVISSGDCADIEIMFVDFGTITTVGEADLREIESRYLNLPFQAIECTLANITVPTNQEDYEKGTELLKETIQSQVLSAKVISSSDEVDVRRLEVLLVLHNGIDVGEFLVGNNAAIYKPGASWE